MTLASKHLPPAFNFLFSNSGFNKKGNDDLTGIFLSVDISLSSHCSRRPDVTLGLLLCHGKK